MSIRAINGSSSYPGNSFFDRHQEVGIFCQPVVGESRKRVGEMHVRPGHQDRLAAEPEVIKIPARQLLLCERHPVEQIFGDGPVH